MVETKSPNKLRDFKSELSFFFGFFRAWVVRRELCDTDRIVTINLKREESLAVVDRHDDFWELCRNRNGRYNMRKLKKE